MKTITKNLLKFIKKYLGELMIIIGSGIFVYNILDFTHMRLISRTVRYYFSHDTISWITFGAVLIVIGFFIIKNKKGVKKI